MFVENFHLELFNNPDFWDQSTVIDGEVVQVRKVEIIIGLKDYVRNEFGKQIAYETDFLPLIHLTLNQVNLDQKITQSDFEDMIMRFMILDSNLSDSYKALLKYRLPGYVFIAVSNWLRCDHAQAKDHIYDQMDQLWEEFFEVKSEPEKK